MIRCAIAFALRLVPCVLAQPAPSGAAQPAAEASGPPPVFSAMGFDEALKETVGTDRILVVKATADWCVPCKMMDRTTWRDPKVESWFKANGRVTAIDIDRNKPWASEHRIGPIPTMVVFRDGKEFDRAVGAQSAEELVSWLDGVKQGRTEADAIAKKLDDARAGKAQVSMQEWLQHAGYFASSGKPDLATREYAWLWDNIAQREPQMASARGSFMATAMQKLASEHPPAKERFRAMRDAAAEKLSKTPPSDPSKPVDSGPVEDLLILNKVVGEEERNVEWFLSVRDKPDAAPLLERVAYRLEELLSKRGLWFEMSALYPDPLKKFQFDKSNVEMARQYAQRLPQQQGDELLRQMLALFRDATGRMHASLLAAGREAEANRLSAEAITADDTGPMRIALVRWGLQARQVPQTFEAWLDEAGAKGENVAQLKAEVAAKRQR